MRTVGDHGDERVDDRKAARTDPDLPPLQTSRVPASVVALVVMTDAWKHLPRKVDVLEQAEAALDMALELPHLMLVEPALRGADLRADPRLADIAQQGGDGHLVERLSVGGHLLGQRLGEAHGLMRGPAEVPIAELQKADQDVDHLEE